MTTLLAEFKVYKWLRANTVDRFSLTASGTESSSSFAAEGVWKERQDAEDALKKYLSDLPSAYAVTCYELVQLTSLEQALWHFCMDLRGAARLECCQAS